MDPSSAAVAVVGFAASVITLCSLAVDASKTLYELQDQVRNAPKELRTLYSTMKSLECMLVEIQQQVLDLDQLVDSPRLLESWKETISQLEECMKSFRAWLHENFKSQDIGRIGRKQLLQRVKVFFAEKKIEAFRQSITEYTSKLGLLQGLTISLQSRNLARSLDTTAQVTEATSLSVSELRRVVPDVVVQIRRDIVSTSVSSLKTMESLRNDITQLREVHLASIQTMQQTLHSLGIYRGMPGGRCDSMTNAHGKRQFFPNSLTAHSPDPARSQISSESASFIAKIHLPIGSLYYRRRRERTPAHANDQLSGLYITFVPARWVSKWAIRMSIEWYWSRDMTRTLSVHLQPPGRICLDRDVLASVGLRVSAGTVKFCNYRKPDPENFRHYLDEGRVRPNDLIFCGFLGLVTLLEMIVVNACRHPTLTYQLCKILLSCNARLDLSSTEHGSPLYIALEGGLEILHQKDNDCIKGVYCRTQYPPSQLPDLLSLPLLLLQNGSTFHNVPAYGPHRNRWSEEDGWLPKLMRLSSDTEYICQVFFKNLGFFDLENFGKADRWLISLLCYTYPEIRATLKQQLSVWGQKEAQIFPSALEFSTMLEEVKTAPIEDRCFFISVICRYGNVALLRPLLLGDFDLNEHVKHDIPGLHDITLPYLCQATKKFNLETINALIDAGAILTRPFHLTYMIRRRRGSYGIQERMAFIEAAFRAFDFDGCPDKENLLSAWLQDQRPHFRDSTKESHYILDKFVNRGCFSTRPPTSLDLILGPELRDAILYGSSLLVSHLLQKYKPHLELLEVYHDHLARSSRACTALGLALIHCHTDVVQKLLNAGADIAGPISGGCSALEIVKSIMKRDMKRKTNRQHAEFDCDSSTCGSPDKLFDMLITALRNRGDISVADQALLEIRGNSAGVIVEVVQESQDSTLPALRIPSIIETAFGYFRGDEFISENWHHYYCRFTWMNLYPQYVAPITRITSDVLCIGYGI